MAELPRLHGSSFRRTLQQTNISTNKNWFFWLFQVSNEEGVKEFANPMFKDTAGATVVGRKVE